MTSLLVTGGRGYLGTVLTRRALRLGYRVIVLDRAPAAPSGDPPGLVAVCGDLRRPQDWCDVLQDVDAVVHLAAVVGDAACDVDPELTWQTNYLVTVGLAEACRRYGVSRFVFASTCSNYGAALESTSDIWSPVNPQSLYARTKTLAEHYLLSVRGPQLDPCILRFATLHGLSPRMRFDLVVNRMTAAAVRDGVIEVHGGEQWRPFLHVLDAAEAILAAVSARSTYAVLNCGSTAENYRIGDLGRLVQQEVPEARLAYLPGIQDRRDYRVDFEPIRTELHFDPKVSMRESIREIADALRQGSFAQYRDAMYHNHLTVAGLAGDAVGAA